MSGAATAMASVPELLYGPAVKRVFPISMLLLSACSAGRAPARDELSPGFVLPHRIAEGSGDAIDPDGPALAPAAPTAAPAPSSAPSAAAPDHALPDPEALRLAEQYEYELLWDAGSVSVVGVAPRVYPRPVVTARRMGRFAIELWIGKELVERVRFDFPLLALDETPSSGSRTRQAPSLETGARATARVLVPAATRARRAVLVDRATRTETPLEWPPAVTAPIAGPPAARP